MLRTYGPVKPGRDDKHIVKKSTKRLYDGMYKTCYNALGHSKLGLNVLLGILLIILFIGCIGGYIILNNLNHKTTTEVAVTETHARDDSQPAIIAKAETQTENVIHIYDIQSLVAEYDIENVKEGDLLDISKIDVLVTYDDNRTIVAKAGQFNISENAKEPLKAGENQYIITYNTEKCMLTVNAEALSDFESKVAQYTEEFENADVTYASDSLWVTGTKYRDKDTYWIYHVLCTPNNPPKMALSKKKYRNVETILKNEVTNGWIFGVNGSYYDNTFYPADGLYMNDGVVYSERATTSGNELCITSDGCLFTPEPNMSAEDLLEMGVVDTIISYSPALIKDGEPTVLPQGADTNCNAKTIVAMKDRYEYYILIAADGMYTNYNTYTSLTQQLLDRGCVYAKVVSNASNVTAALNGEIVIAPPVANKPLIDVFAFYE